uniref:Small hydrophobic protein n=1 Tax=avian metapneumovirus TaxID=38525 RepID=A0A481Y789_9MONO|nr:small hydrophobic protein [Avian metapneumovirus]
MVTANALAVLNIPKYDRIKRRLSSICCGNKTCVVVILLTVWVLLLTLMIYLSVHIAGVEKELETCNLKADANNTGVTSKPHTSKAPAITIQHNGAENADSTKLQHACLRKKRQCSDYVIIVSDNLCLDKILLNVDQCTDMLAECLEQNCSNNNNVTGTCLCTYSRTNITCCFG